MKRVLLLLVLLSILFQGQAQKFNYEDNSKFFIGLNIGRVWHTSDVQRVKDQFPLGGGFLIGRTFNSDYGRLFNYDLRLRYLDGNWYGQDTDTTASFHQNTAASAIYDSLGTMVQNFKSTQHRVAIELAIHANRLRDNTGIDPYIFAGIGLTATRTQADYMNKELPGSDGAPYDYTTFSNEIQSDEKYETLLDKNAAGEAYVDDEFETRILPSLGFGLGYYFNDRFSVGFEHKSTFVNDDYFDGTTLNQDGEASTMFKNDIYHYTSVYFTWHLRNKKYRADKRRTTTPSSPVPPIDNDTEEENHRIENEDDEPVDFRQPPEVAFTNPTSSPYTTNSPSYTLRATVQYVTGYENVSFLQDGQVNASFSFNPMTNRFESSVQLKPGQNVFMLKGVNNDGSDADQTIIVYQRANVDPVEPKQPPVVTITDPVSAPKTVRTSTYKVNATIQHVRVRNQLTVTFNGRSLSNYSYSPSGNNNFMANLNLKSGENTLKIVGKNADGSDSDETIIVYERNTVANPPVVDFTNPSRTRVTVTSPEYNLKGSIKKVADRSDVQFSNNGVLSDDFNFDHYSAQFNANIILNPGQNIFQIKGTNEAGSDEDVVVIRYEVERPKPPVVVITTPSADPKTTQKGSEPIVASVLNVEKKQNIQVSINGIQTIQFTYNAISNKVIFDANLEAGSNTIKIVGSNNVGTASDDTKIVYRKPTSKNPPNLTFVQPAKYGTIVYVGVYRMKAIVEHVDKASDVEVFFNGKTVNTSDFTFNTSTHMVTYNTTLDLGSNSFIVRGTNTDGTDVVTTKITRKRRIIADPQIDADIEKNPAEDDDSNRRDDKETRKPQMESKPEKRNNPTREKEESKPSQERNIRNSGRGGGR